MLYQGGIADIFSGVLLILCQEVAGDFCQKVVTDVVTGCRQ